MTAYSAGSAAFVWNELQSLSSTPLPSVYDLLRVHPESLGGNMGDSYYIPAIDDITVNADGSSTMSVFSPTVSQLSLVVDREPAVCVGIDRRREEQMLNGNGSWSRELAKESQNAIFNYRERDVLDRMLTSAWVTGSTATYWVNAAGAALSSAIVRRAIAGVESQRGATNNIALVIDAYAASGIREFVGFTATQNAPGNGEMFGIRKIGEFDGFPVYVSKETPGSSARGRRTVASTANQVATNVLTITVGPGHNIVPGQFITFSTVTTANNVTTAAAVTSTTATTVVVPLTASNSGPNTEAGTITVRDATNFAVDLGHNWKAETGRMLVKFGEEPRTTGRNLIVSPLYGTVHRVGRTICFGSPFSALS